MGSLVFGIAEWLGNYADTLTLCNAGHDQRETLTSVVARGWMVNEGSFDDAEPISLPNFRSCVAKNDSKFDGLHDWFLTFLD